MHIFPPFIMKRFIASLGVLAAVLPTAASASLPLFSVDVCKYAIIIGGKDMNVKTRNSALCVNRVFNMTFSTRYLCNGTMTIKDGSTDVTAQFQAANC